MSKNVSYSKGEKYNSLSKKDGFRSRAAYKLIQIQKQNKIIKAGDKVLDIGMGKTHVLQLMQEYLDYESFNKKNNDFIRSYMSGLKIVHADSASRILIPKDLIEFARLEKQIVLSSSVNIIEVWDKNEYEKSVSKSLKKFGDLAEEVMGDDNE